MSTPFQCYDSISSSIITEPKKLRNVSKIKENFIADVIKNKMTKNILLQDNIKLRTRLSYAHDQLSIKDKKIKEILGMI